MKKYNVVLNNGNMNFHVESEDFFLSDIGTYEFLVGDRVVASFPMSGVTGVMEVTSLQP